MSSKLFLELKNDSKFHIIDENNKSIGAAYEIPDAIKHVRKITDSPIDIEDDHAGNHRYVVSEKPEDAIEDTETFIAALAEIAGMKVTKNLDENLHFLGWTMELIE